MTRHLTFAALALAAFCGVRAETSYPVLGDVTGKCAVAVSAKAGLYVHATPNRENALAAELRVRDDKGAAVPYALRRRSVREMRETFRWHDLILTEVRKQDGQLIVETELPRTNDEHIRFTTLDVVTPLKDFEQVVTVRVGGETRTVGAICDYSRFASFRRTGIPVDLSSADRITVVFAKPVTEVESSKFERTIVENGEGALESKTLRRAVVEQPFLVYRLRLGETVRTSVFDPAPSEAADCRAEIERDANEKKTSFVFDTYGLPVTAVGIRTSDENFSRRARVFVRRNNGWSPIAEGTVRSISLPGRSERVLDVPLGREVSESVLRLELDDGDNPPLSFEELPIRLFVAPYDIVFIAAPGARYSLAIEKGAECPRYDAVVLDYINTVSDPLRLDADISDDFGSNAPIAVWMTFDPLPLIAGIVFLILLVVCLCLFKLRS